jgi:hypothetical protein
MKFTQTIQLASVLIATLLLSGCGPSDPIVSKTQKWYEITEIKPPKRFKVSVRDEDGHEFSMLSVSKRCSAWQKLKIGSRWLLVEVVRQGKHGNYIQVYGADQICDKLQAM